MKNISIYLPSKGKFGKKSINVQVPTVNHVRDFLSVSGNITPAINQLVNELSDTNIDSYPTGDRDYVFVTVRQLINPLPIDGSFLCDNCNTPNNFSMGLEEVEVISLPDDFVNPSILTLPISKEEIKITLLTVEKETEVREYLKVNENSDTPELLKHIDLGDELEMFSIYAAMLEMEGNLDDKITFLRNLPYVDFELIMLYDSTFSVGPVMKAKRVCSCGKEWQISVPLDSNFLGISVDSLIAKHRFLSKTTSVGYNDFLSYTMDEMDHVVDKEVEHQEKLRADREKTQRKR